MISTVYTPPRRQDGVSYFLTINLFGFNFLGENDACILYRHKDDLRLKCTGLRKATGREIDFIGDILELDNPTAFRMFHKGTLRHLYREGKVSRWGPPWKQF